MVPLPMEEPGSIAPQSMTREIIVLASGQQLRIAMVQALSSQVHRQNSRPENAIIASR
jgi:hypothetical protein